MSTASTDSESPCVRVCILDRVQRLCIGCYRTLDEISFWTRYSETQRQEVLAQIEIRRATIKLED
ncbi:MAG: DUF1289 domain-containing protein [Burkholderiales bacterium]|nr:DUF1289 domain-containing protein [Burkholderiales bacterium]